MKSLYSDITNIQDIINFSGQLLLNFNKFKYINLDWSFHLLIINDEEFILDKISCVLYKNQNNLGEYDFVFEYDDEKLIYVKVTKDGNGYIYFCNDKSIFLALLYPIDAPDELKNITKKYLAEKGVIDIISPGLLRFNSQKYTSTINSLNHQRKMWLDIVSDHTANIFYSMQLIKCSDAKLLKTMINYERAKNIINNFNSEHLNYIVL